MNTFDFTIKAQAGSDPQIPIATNSFQMFAVDVDEENSDIGNFTGSITDPFDNIYTVIEDSTANNPKTLIIAAKRTTFTSFVGLGCDSGTFSNVKMTFIGSDGDIKAVVDDSANSTPQSSLSLIVDGTEGFNIIKLEFFTTNTICLANIVIPKVNRMLSQIQAKSELTGLPENVASFKNALKVDTALVHTKGVNAFFFRETGVTNTLAIATLETDTSVTVVDGSVFNVGDKVRITNGILTGQIFFTITVIATNLLTLDRPVNVAQPIGSAVDVVTTNMSVSGTLSTPVVFRLQPPSGAIWNIARILVTMTDNTAMDDGKFGGQVALTNGVNFRVIKGNGEIENTANWKKNGDLKSDMFNIDYAPKAPAGQYGLSGRWTYTESEYAIELNGDDGDIYEARVQDNLTQLSFETKGQGRIFNA